MTLAAKWCKVMVLGLISEQVLGSRVRFGPGGHWPSNHFLPGEVCSESATQVTDAERVAVLEARVDELMELLRLALTPKQRSNNAIRQARYRERHESVTNNATRNATRNDPLESVTPTSLQEDVLTVPSEKEVGNSHTEPALQKRYSVTFDRARAESDAAAKGITGDAFEAELQHFTDYWDSAGWKRKNGPVKDRNATWRTWLDSPYRNGKNGNGHRPKQDFLAGLREWNERMDAMEATQ